MKEIKEFDTFSGTDGYLIVDGIDENTPGGKKLLSEIGGGNPFSLDEMLTWTNTTGTSLADWLEANPESNHVDAGNLQTSIKLDGAVVKYQYVLHVGSGSFLAPWAS